jgi:hypothetical protein
MDYEVAKRDLDIAEARGDAAKIGVAKVHFAEIEVANLRGNLARGLVTETELKEKCAELKAVRQELEAARQKSSGAQPPGPASAPDLPVAYQVAEVVRNGQAVSVRLELEEAKGPCTVEVQHEVPIPAIGTLPTPESFAENVAQGYRLVLPNRPAKELTWTLPAGERKLQMIVVYPDDDTAKSAAGILTTVKSAAAHSHDDGAILAATGNVHGLCNLFLRVSTPRQK